MAALLRVLATLSLALLLPQGVNAAAVEKRQPIFLYEPAVMGKGYYPRATYVNDGVLLGCFTSRADNVKSIQIVRSDDDGRTWSPWSSVLEVQANTHGLDNCFLHQLPNRGSILLAFRDHTKSSPDGSYTHHSLQVYGSDSGGRNWELRSVVDENEVTGRGIYEPFMFDGADNSLQLYFTRETRGDGKDQNNYLARSSDGGRTWKAEQTVSGGDIQARDGMTGVVRLTSGKLLAVFESLAPDTGIILVSSTDDGKTWGNRRVLHNADRGTANAPYIAKVGSTLVLTFYEGYARPGSKDVKLLTSTDSGVTWGSKTDVCNNCEWAGQVVVDDNTFIVLTNTFHGADDGTNTVNAWRMTVG